MSFSEKAKQALMHADNIELIQEGVLAEKS